jgi:hypothetical protein
VTFAEAKYNAANLDPGHFVAGNNTSQVPFLKQHPRPHYARARQGSETQQRPQHAVRPGDTPIKEFGVNQMKPSYLLSPASLLVFLFAADSGSAQSAGRRVELGGQAAILRVEGSSGGRSTTNGGVGGRVSFDLTHWMALDGEVSVFPRETVAGPESGGTRLLQYRRRTDARAGLRIGAHGERLGVFLNARPGITYLAHQRGGCEGPGCSLMLPPPVADRYRTEFAFDIGGGVEFYPSARTVARAEIGDTMIRHGNAAPPWLAPSSRTSHNLSSRFGVGFRF